jgi:hypothetical protein
MISLPESFSEPRRQSFFSRPVAIGIAALLFSLLAHDWIAGLAVVVLFVGWHYLSNVEDGPPVLAIAFSTQWLQVNSAVFYEALFGRRIDAMDYTDYRPMVLISLGCLVALLIGLRVGLVFGRSSIASLSNQQKEAFPLSKCVVVYLA